MLIIPMERSEGHHIMETDRILELYPDSFIVNEVRSVKIEPMPCELVRAEVERTIVYRDGTVRHGSDRIAFGKQSLRTVELVADDGSSLFDGVVNHYPSDMIPDLFGGQVLVAVMDDGGALCEECVRDITNPVHAGGDADGWRVDGWMGSSDLEDPTWCDHCGRVLVAEADV